MVGEVSWSVSWRMAVSVPSRFAASAIRCTVGGRWPTEVNICARVRLSCTGRRVTRAASAASMVCGHWKPLQPKPPPVNGQSTRTFSRGMPKTWARTSRVPTTACVASSTVSRSPSQRATVAEGSIGLLVSTGVV